MFSELHTEKNLNQQTGI